MGKDAAESRLEEFNDVFADIVDNLVLDGMRIVREDNLVSKSAKSYSGTGYQDGMYNDSAYEDQVYVLYM